MGLRLVTNQRKALLLEVLAATPYSNNQLRVKLRAAIAQEPDSPTPAALADYVRAFYAPGKDRDASIALLLQAETAS